MSVLAAGERRVTLNDPDARLNAARGHGVCRALPTLRRPGLSLMKAVRRRRPSV
jgi:hypothetical protein